MSNQTQESQVDQKDLKAQALLERISQLTTQYEEQVANLRVALTVVSSQLEEYKSKEANVQETPEETS